MPPAIPAPRADGTTTTTAHPLYYRIDGPTDAEPLLLLHGGPGAHHDYLYPQYLALAATHRLITYDQRGGGRSRVDDPAPITAATHVGDLAQVIREFTLEPVTLVGYSWGALLAMLYAIASVADDERTRDGQAASAARSHDTPPAVARLVLISPAPVTRDWRRQFESDLAERQRNPAIADARAALSASGLREQDPDAFRQRAFELSVAGYFADPSRAHSLTPFRVTGRTQSSTWDSLGDFDLRGDLARLRVPALVVHGRQDPIPLASAESVATALGARLEVLDDCGHVPYVEQPDALFAAIAEFLRDTGA